MKTLIISGMAALGLLLAPMAHADHPTPPDPTFFDQDQRLMHDPNTGTYDEQASLRDSDGTQGDFDDGDGPGMQFQNPDQSTYPSDSTYPGHDFTHFYVPQTRA